MEKEKENRIVKTLTMAVIIICLGLIILELQMNIHNELNVNF